MWAIKKDKKEEDEKGKGEGSEKREDGSEYREIKKWGRRKKEWDKEVGERKVDTINNWVEFADFFN